MGKKVSDHFALSEFLPSGMDESLVPEEIVANIAALALNLLEPLRQEFGVPVVIHSGFRAISKERGTEPSDHQRGAAADFHVSETVGVTWEENTIASFDWLRLNKAGKFGQLILEDRRLALRDPGKLWVHVSLRSPKHDGTVSDRNRLLLSYVPGTYEIWKEANFA